MKRCVPDVIHAGEQLGAESAIPYLNSELTGEKLLVGANFASAGIGVLNDTGIQFVSTKLTPRLQMLYTAFDAIITTNWKLN